MTDLRTLIDLVEHAQIEEKYSENNRYLLKYLKDGNFDPYACWHEVCEWIQDNDYLDEMSEFLGEPIEDADSLREHDPDVFYKLPPIAQKICGEHCIEYLMQHDPAEAPSTAYMDLKQQKLLPRTTWLIHFSDNAVQIAYQGFKYGIDQMDKLGLTTYWGDNAKKYGGYNFAFLADGRHAQRAAHQGSYGSEAVIFQNSGVIVHHHGDEEDQVIFHGTDVNPRDIVYLAKKDGDWAVMTKRSKTADSRVVFKGDFDAVVAWVMKHFAQYRKALTGF